MLSYNQQAIVLIFSLLFLIAIIFVLQRTKIKMLKAQQKGNVKNKWLVQIVKIKNKDSSPTVTVSQINSLYRRFLEENWGISKKTEYAEIIDVFKIKGEKKLLELTRLLLEATYSGETIKTTTIKEIINLFEETAKENKKI